MAKATPKPDYRDLGGDSVNQVLWETETAVLFHDSKDHFRKYLKASLEITFALIS
jgi:hypothetical protein